MTKLKFRSKKAFEAKKRRKIEIDKFKKQKALQQYEKLCRSEGITSSERIKLDKGSNNIKHPNDHVSNKSEVSSSTSKKSSYQHQSNHQEATAKSGSSKTAATKSGQLDDAEEKIFIVSERRQRRYQKGSNKRLGSVAVSLLEKIQKTMSSS
jgi:hypothetical protein